MLNNAALRPSTIAEYIMPWVSGRQGDFEGDHEDPRHLRQSSDKCEREKLCFFTFL